MIRELAIALCLIASPALADGPPKPPDQALQAAKMQAFSMLEGEWAGEGWTMTPKGRFDYTQSESVAPMLQGKLLKVHGTGKRPGAGPDEPPVFEALGIISYDESEAAYFMRSYANGYVGDFEIVPRANGFSWSAGPVRYDATVENGVWTETGWRKDATGKEIKFLEMTVRRVSP
jgi:hypothetical protein